MCALVSIYAFIFLLATLRVDLLGFKELLVCKKIYAHPAKKSKQPSYHLWTEYAQCCAYVQNILFNLILGRNAPNDPNVVICYPMQKIQDAKILNGRYRPSVRIVTANVFGCWFVLVCFGSQCESHVIFLRSKHFLLYQSRFDSNF